MLGEEEMDECTRGGGIWNLRWTSHYIMHVQQRRLASPCEAALYCGFIFCFYAARLGAVVCVSTFLCTTSTAIPFPGVNVSSPMYISTYIYFSSIHVLQTNKCDGDKLSGWSGLADAMRCWLCSQDRISTSSLGFGCSTQPLQGYWHRCLTNAFPRPVRSFCLAKSYNVFPTRCDLQKFNHTLTCCLTIR